MSILASFIVPHPPLIIEEIGKDRINDIILTKNSYEKVAKEIQNLNPETIIISSPHAPMYRDWFYISNKPHIDGSFASFGAGEVEFHEEIDIELTEKIFEIAKEENFPTGEVPNKELDHGVMVPLYFIRKLLPKTKIIVIGISGLSLVDHYKLGIIIQKAVNDLNRKTVYVASGDLSHKLQENGPYGFIPEGPVYDKRIMEDCKNASFDKLFDYEPAFLEKVAQCGHRSFVMMAGALDRVEVVPTFYSHEDITGVGYGILSYYPKGYNDNCNYLDIYLNRSVIKESEDPYVSLARKTINTYIREGKTISVPENLPEEMIKNRSGVFVSIHEFGELRGCIGTFMPCYDSIAKEIILNAIAAATRDYRFSPITTDELDYLEINVDVLTTPETIDSPEQLDTKKYGVIVSSGNKRGLLLPDLEGIDTIEKQIEIAKRKGNIKENEEVTLQRFEVIRHK